MKIEGSLLGELLDESVTSGNYANKVIHLCQKPEYKHVRGNSVFILALTIGAVCEGDVEFFDDPFVRCFYHELWPYDERMYDIFKEKARERKPFNYQVDLF